MKIVKAFATLALVCSLSDRANANDMPHDEPLYQEALQLGYETYEDDPTFSWWFWLVIGIFVACVCC